jgi:C4-dicarboxylate-specific signal transduction histidine kinase
MTKKKSKKFKIDARLILQLGRDSIKDHSTALIELVKNSFDADASKVEVEIWSKGEENYIRVADNGFGMTETEIDNNWLKIGYSEKKSSKNSQKGRRRTGEKGIGRIASDRLGSNLNMVTKSDSDVIQGIKVNWDEFDVEGKSIEDIELKAIESPEINIPKKDKEEQKETGTELIISNLREEWTEENIKHLYQELSYFAPLFKNEFEIEIKNDISQKYSKVVSSAIYDTSEIDLILHYDGKNTLIYEFKNKILPEKNKTETFKLKHFLQQESYAPLKCGAIDLSLSFFVRKKGLLEGTDFSLNELKDFLTENYGVKLYRDNVVVKPYGFSNNQFGQDWLGLDVEKSKDPAAVSRKTYRVNANNVIGSVNFKRDDNSALIDSSSREGLVENEAFLSMKNLINASIVLLSQYRVDIYKKSDKPIVIKDATSAYVKRVKEKLSTVVNDIKNLREDIEQSKVVETSIFTNSITTIETVIDETEKTFEELLDEKRVLSALATLGISSSVFGHETESAISTFRHAANNAKGYLTLPKPDTAIAIEQLTEALKQAKLISSWGVFALSRIEKDKRIKRNRRIGEIIKRVINQIKPALDSLEIEIETKLENVMAATYVMDVESIFLNLLTNAFSAVPNSDRPRKIKIELDHENRGEVKGLEFSVSDSGPGIAKEYIDKIWTPLFTTKIGEKERESGTGLGLTIVKSIVTELSGDVRVEIDKELKGAKFIVWLPRK